MKILKIIFLQKNGTYVEEYTTGHLCTKFEEFILIYEAMIAKTRFDLLLAVNKVKVTKLWCNSNLICRATYWMYILSFKLISQSMLKKSPENADRRTDGRTDGRTLPRHNTPVFSNGRIKMSRSVLYWRQNFGMDHWFNMLYIVIKDIDDKTLIQLALY